MSDYLSTLGDVAAGAAGFVILVFGVLLVIVGIAATICEGKARYFLLSPLGFLMACVGGAWLLYVMRFW